MRKRNTIILCCAAGLLACLLSLSGCGASAQGSSGGASSPDASISTDPGPDVSGSASLPEDNSSSSGAASSSQPDGSEQEPDSAPYDFSSPVPASDPVDNSYFQDAAFIGDSRTDGFLIYSGIGCGENLTSNGLSIFKLEEKKAFTIDGTKYTLLDALGRQQYGKVYISLGINELGYYDDQGFYEAYCQTIDLIRQCQPHAVIYIQGLIPLNEDVIAQTGGASYLKNDHLLIYNDLMKQVAEEKQVAFLDLNPYFAGEDGQLPAEASTDGIHLRKAYCEQWLEYLKAHTVSYETLYGTEESA